MITKAIIKSTPALDGNKYTVYIPILRNANDSESDAIFEATLAYIPGIYYSFSVDDVVFVSFEDNLYNKPVILGKLFTEKDKNVKTQVEVKTLKVLEKVDLGGAFSDNTLQLDDTSGTVQGLLSTVADLKTGLSSIVEIISEGELTSLDISTANRYDLIFIYGYKRNVGTPNQTCFVFMPSQINSQTNFQIEQVALSTPNIWNYRLQLNIGSEGTRLWWFTDIDYGGDDSFIATRIIGVKRPTYES